MIHPHLLPSIFFRKGDLLLCVLKRFKGLDRTSCTKISRVWDTASMQTPPCSHFFSTLVSKGAMLHINLGMRCLHPAHSPVPQAAHHSPPVSSCCNFRGSCGFLALDAPLVDGAGFSSASFAYGKAESLDRTLAFPSSLLTRQTKVAQVTETDNAEENI